MSCLLRDVIWNSHVKYHGLCIYCRTCNSKLKLCWRPHRVTVNTTVFESLWFSMNRFPRWGTKLRYSLPLWFIKASIISETTMEGCESFVVGAVGPVLWSWNVHRVFHHLPWDSSFQKKLCVALTTPPQQRFRFLQRRAREKRATCMDHNSYTRHRMFSICARTLLISSGEAASAVWLTVVQYLSTGTAAHFLLYANTGIFNKVMKFEHQ